MSWPLALARRSLHLAPGLLAEELAHIDPGQRGISHYVAVVTAKRRLVAQRLLDGDGDEVAVGGGDGVD